VLEGWRLRIGRSPCARLDGVTGCADPAGEFVPCIRIAGLLGMRRRGANDEHGEQEWSDDAHDPAFMPNGSELAQRAGAMR
jgi:hypothetical protein